jgi:hypothetical protein
MVKFDPALLDQMAELEIKALLEGLSDEELRRNPSFLEKVRKFMKDNRLETTPESNRSKKRPKNSQFSHRRRL